MAIPAFDHNLVLPPHLGNPTAVADLSPYPCTSLELCQRFATSSERIDILIGFLKFRERLNLLGLIKGMQWLDGSFLEDVETQQKRSPRDLDLVTIYWDYDLTFQKNLVTSFPEFIDSSLSKANFKLDHYPLDAGYHPLKTVEMSRYWAQLFSHNRNGVWKGMLSIELGTPGNDNLAMMHLKTGILS